MNGIVKNISALSIHTTGQIPKFTRGQSALLKLIRECIERKQPLTFDLIVLTYYNNIRKQFSKRHYIGSDEYGHSRYSYSDHDILESWREQKDLWYFKALIRQWFISTIGILVIKNQLVIIPTIDLGEEEVNG
jgi:hypothetical protein